MYGSQDGEWVQDDVDMDAEERATHRAGPTSTKQQEIEKERLEIEAMLTKNDRNLRDARHAVAAGSGGSLSIGY